MDKQLAETLFAAYRQGLLRVSKPRPWEAQSRQFDFLFRQVFWTKIPVYERLPIWRIWRLGAKGLQLSRQNELEEASRIFSNCWENLRSAGLSERGMLLAIPPLESAHAYSCYKKGEFDTARARILNAMEVDFQLEREDDFILLELHRIQSAQNLMRIDLRAGEPARALALAGEILAYIDGFKASLSVHHSWQHHKLLTKIPLALRRALIPQVANEVVLAFSFLAMDHPEDEFLSNINIEDYANKSQVLHEQFRRWLLAKQAFHKDDWNHYIQQLLEFLPMGRNDIGPIWYSTMFDILALCCKLESRISISLYEAILRDAEKWPGLPPCLSSKLGICKDCATGASETSGRMET